MQEIESAYGALPTVQRQLVLAVLEMMDDSPRDYSDLIAATMNVLAPRSAFSAKYTGPTDQLGLFDDACDRLPILRNMYAN